MCHGQTHDGGDYYDDDDDGGEDGDGDDDDDAGDDDVDDLTAILVQERAPLATPGTSLHQGYCSDGYCTHFGLSWTAHMLNFKLHWTGSCMPQIALDRKLHTESHKAQLQRTGISMKLKLKFNISGKHLCSSTDPLVKGLWLGC